MMKGAGRQAGRQERNGNKKTSSKFCNQKKVIKKISFSINVAVSGGKESQNTHRTKSKSKLIKSNHLTFSVLHVGAFSYAK